MKLVEALALLALPALSVSVMVKQSSLDVAAFAVARCDIPRGPVN